MRKLLFFFPLLYFIPFNSAGQGFQNFYWPNLSTYDHTGFYINGAKMITGGNYNNGVKASGTLIVADTSGNISTSWALDEASADWGMKNIRRMDANNSLISGVSYIFPTSALLAKINHTTGAVAFSKYFSGNAAFGNAFSATDALTLSNGDFALTGTINENKGSTSCPSGMGSCQAPVSWGYRKIDFGTNGYGRSNDICLVRTNGSGDSLWVKKYNLAYDMNGAFNYCPFPAWGADSSRLDVPNKVIEAGTNIFMAGHTIDYSRACSNNYTDYQSFVMKVNSAGVLQWCKTFFLATFPASEYAVDLAAVTSDASNDIIVLMRSDNSGNAELFRLQNATGNILWAKSFDCGSADRGWGLKETPDGKFIVGIVSNIAGIGGYDMILMKIDRNGNFLNAKGVGTVNMDGMDLAVWWGPNVDAFSAGSYAIAGVTEYAGGNNGKSYVAKIMNQPFSTGCPSHEFNVSVTVTDRMSTVADLLHFRTPLVYETRGGLTVGNLALTSAVITPAKIDPCLLPVEFLNFSAEWKKENAVNLSWTTASEKNNKYFTIERAIPYSPAAEGLDFVPIGTIAGAENSSAIRNYQFTDKPEFQASESELIYYRLQQTDFDGKSEYSPAIAVRYSGPHAFSIFADKNARALNVSFRAESGQAALLRLCDITGREVLSQSFSEHDGMNIFSVPLPDIRNGIYLVSLTSSERTLTKKIVIDF